MASPRWHKVIRDLWQNKARAFLVVLAIAVGIFGFGSVAVSYSILARELNNGYLATNPASATLWTDPFDDDFVQAVRNLPGIRDAVGRQTVTGRIRVGPDEWRTLWLFVIGDYANIRVNLLEPEQGAWPPADGEILLEREALSVAGAKIGDTVVVKTPNGPQQELRLVGTVHDSGQAPAWMEGMVYGYITRGTLARLGESPDMDELSIVVAENTLDKAHIRSVAYQVKDWAENNGRRVYRIEVPQPGKHPHADQMSALLYLQAAFGLLALVLSGVLVVNMISALLAGQIRQIGVMKAVGARTRQVMGIYFGAVLILGLAALAVASPVNGWVGRAYAAFTADLLNFDIVSDAIPPWVFVFQIIVGLLVPILVAAYPIYRGSQITVQQAISDYGVGQGTFGTSLVDRLLGQMGGLARPLLLSIRNTFRRRGRLALTLGTLAVGGAIFVAGLNVRASVSKTVEVSFGSLKYDIELSFSRPYPVEQIEQAVRNIPGVVRVESWGGAEAALVYSDGTSGNRFNVIAPPTTTELIQFPIIEGRWLLPGDQNALVVNHLLLDKEPSIQVGDKVTLKIGKQETIWQVVGVVQQRASMPTAYANYGYLAEVIGQTGTATGVRVVTKDHDPATQTAIKRSLEQNFASAGLDVLRNTSIADRRKIIEDHLVVIVTFLILMSLLIAGVGGLGLMTTMSLNVLERTREIGVMRAIGASNQTVLRIIVTEGAAVGLLSWLIALALAWPISIVIGNTLGMILLQATLEFVFAPLGLALWLAIVIVFAAAASFYPAWSAARLTVREAVAYE